MQMMTRRSRPVFARILALVLMGIVLGVVAGGPDWAVGSDMDFGGYFPPEEPDHTTTYVLVDVDGDGDEDWVEGHAGTWSGKPNKVFLNDGTGSFTDSGQELGSFHTKAVALGDVDGDGDLDLVTGNVSEYSPSGSIGSDASNRVYLNDGNGAFTDSGQMLGWGSTVSVVLGDVDGDGDIDLVEGNHAQSSRVYLNDGKGTFTETGQKLARVHAETIALGDVDGDGDLDLIMGGMNAHQVYLNNGKGFFTHKRPDLVTRKSARAVALYDVDGDGDPDMVVGRLNDLSHLSFVGLSPFVSVYLNDGTGAFVAMSEWHMVKYRGKFLPQIDGTSTFVEAGPLTVVSGEEVETRSVALGDLDGDGDLDMVAGNNYHPSRVYLNDGAGIFTITRQGMGKRFLTGSVVLGDVDGDGDLDLVTGNKGKIDARNFRYHYGFSRVYLNDGKGRFTDSGQEPKDGHNSSVALGDLDGDGDLDLMTGGVEQVYLNDGRGGFTKSRQKVRPQGGIKTIALGDVDGDGNPDLVAGVGYDTNLVYLSNGKGEFIDRSQEPESLSRFTALGDVDGDGDRDVVMVEGNNTLIYLDDGQGVFTNSGQRMWNFAAASSVALDDIVGDGGLDMVLEYEDRSDMVHPNDGKGVFDYALSYNFLSLRIFVPIPKTVMIPEQAGRSFVWTDRVRNRWRGE